jgi:hypothetical protein
MTKVSPTISPGCSGSPLPKPIMERLATVLTCRAPLWPD